MEPAMPRCLARIALLVVPGLACAAPASAQRRIAFESPDAVIGRPFSLVRGAVEMANGALIVSDWIEERVAVVDFARGSVTDHGRVGAGPAEFRLPGPLLPFRGDSALLIDVGNARLAVLSADGEIRRTFTPADPSAAYPSGADRDGRLYFTVAAWRASRQLAGDSVELRVYDPGPATTRAIAHVHATTPLPGPAPEPRVPYLIFAPRDGFAVARSGRVALVRDGDYSVHWLDGDRQVDGKPNATQRIRVTDAEKRAFVRDFVLSSPMSGKGPGGSLGHTPAEMASGTAVARMVRASSFAETLPPFRAEDVRVDARGRLWVGRHDRVGEARHFDVFDDHGTRIAEVGLPAGRTLIAIGTAYAYLVRTDDDGLQHIERYSLKPLDAGGASP
jgi:sugar lactone lactonase YvrE